MLSEIAAWYRRWRRYSTPVLAVTATVLLVWSTVAVYGVPLQTMLAFLVICVVGVTAIMALAFVVSLLFVWWRGR